LNGGVTPLIYKELTGETRCFPEDGTNVDYNAFYQNNKKINMLDLNFIRENSEVVKRACKNKNVNIDIDRVLRWTKEKGK